MPQTTTRTIHDEVTFQVEPMTTAEWVEALDEDGTLTSVVALAHDEFIKAVEETGEFVVEMLAVTQAAHVEAFNLAWRMVAVCDDQVMVKVTNNLREFALDYDAVAIFNDTVAAEDRLTRDRLLTLGVTPASIDRFYDVL